MTKTKGENPNLTPKEKKFCQYYVELGNGTQAVYKAGYKCHSDNTAGARANELKRKQKIRAEIKRLQDEMARPSIMTAQEVMEHFTAIARGEEKDQFGLDIGANDRIKALIELAKRTVDIDNKAKVSEANSVVKVTLDWTRPTELTISQPIQMEEDEEDTE